MTLAGMILGTAAYMSPEQAKGKAVDKRADIWAYGCVLFEMLSGRPPFTGETVSETLANVMKSAPPWQTLSASVPANLHELIRRCLVKEPRQRIRDVGDVRLALEGAFKTAAPQTTASATSSAPGGRLAWVACAVASLAAVALAIPTVRHLREVPPSSPPEMRLEITTPPTADPVSLAMSPDGQTIVFVTTEEGRSRLSLRSLDAVSARPLTGTEGASWPFWSPDGRSIGFFADGKLKRIDVGGGEPQNLTDAPGGRGASWSCDGTIIFTPDQSSSPIFRISAAGGEPSPLTRPESGKQTSHRFPQFLPDGRHFLYYVQGIPESRGIYIGYIGDLQGSETSALARCGLGRRVCGSRAAALRPPGNAVCAGLRCGPLGTERERVSDGGTDCAGYRCARIGSRLRIDGRPIRVPDRVGQRPPAVRVAGPVRQGHRQGRRSAFGVER